MTLHHLLAQYFRAKQLAAITEASYTHHINRWHKVVGQIPIREITTETLLQFRQRALSWLRPSSVNSTLRTVKALLRFAHSCGILNSVPHVPFARAQRSVPRMPSLDALGKLYDACDAAQWPPDCPALRWRTLLVTAYFLCLRRRDLIYSLKRPDIDFQSKVVRVVAHKTWRLHVLPLHPIAARHLERMFSLREPDDSGRVFPVGGPCYWHHYQELGRISQWAGWEQRAQLHGIRRLSATQYERARGGAGPLILGHSLGASDFYLDVPELLRDASERLAYPKQFERDPSERQQRLF